MRRLTSEPADLFGLRTRGRLAEGLAADVTVFDPERVEAKGLRRVYDLPGGADRLVEDADGYEAVVVNGVVVRKKNQDVSDRATTRCPDGCYEEARHERVLPDHLRGFAHHRAPETFVDYIDPKWKDKAPVIRNMGERGDCFVIDGMKKPIALGLVAAAGKPPEEITTAGVAFDELHRAVGTPRSVAPTRFATASMPRSSTRRSA